MCKPMASSINVVTEKFALLFSILLIFPEINVTASCKFTLTNTFLLPKVFNQIPDFFKTLFIPVVHEHS